MINPNTGSEMGKREGDDVNKVGNKISGTRMKIMHTILFYVLELTSIIFRLHEPLGLWDWFVFILATGGVIISYWAYYTLGEFYTFTLGVRKNHKLITEGPYKYFVHPGYLGQFLIIGGSVIFYRVYWLFTYALAGYIGYQFLKRTQAEENMLLNKFGSVYQSYVGARWRLIPYVY